MIFYLISRFAVLFWQLTKKVVMV